MAVKTITVLGARSVIRSEGIAGGAITPGHLVEGPATAIIVHNSAGLNAQKKFALENEVVGGDIDDAYASADTVLLGTFPPGSIVLAIADGVGVTAEDDVESNGDGTLRVAAADAATDTAQRESLVGKAMETAAAGIRFRCELY